jgi:hypothetical protein
MVACRLGAVVVACAVLLGCSRHDTHIEPGDKRGALARVAVLPFRTGGMLGESGDISRPSPDVPEVPASVGRHAAHVLGEALRGLELNVVEQGTVDRALEGRSGQAFDTALARELGEQLSASLVAMGVISRYEEREGSALGVQRPATVWYQVALIRSEDGSILGRDEFNYTQRPLAANVLELGRVMEDGGFGWQTREQILDAALERTAQRLVRGLTSPR